MDDDESPKKEYNILYIIVIVVIIILVIALFYYYYYKKPVYAYKKKSFDPIEALNDENLRSEISDEYDSDYDYFSEYDSE